MKKPVKFEKILAKNLQNLSSSGYFIAGHSSYINSLDIDSLCTKIITSSSDLSIKLWDLDTGYIIQEFSTAKVNKTVMFINEKFAVSTSYDTTFTIWNLTVKNLAYTSDGNEIIVKLDVIPCKSLIITACSNFKIYLWTCPSNELFQVFSTFAISKYISINSINWIEYMKPSINGEFLALSTTCKLNMGISSIVLFNLINNSRKYLTNSSHQILQLILDQKSERIFYTTEEKVCRWCFINQFKTCKSPKLSADPRSFSINPDETRLFLGLSDGSIVIFEVENLEILKVYEIHISWVLGVKFDWVRNEILSCSDDKTLKAFSVGEDREIFKFFCHSSWISSLVWTSDEFYFASGSNDKSVKLWCQDENYYLKTFVGHENLVTSIKFSHSERLLVSVSVERIFVWKV